MKKDDSSYEFHILNELSKNGDLTQRSLSHSLGVALGLTNLYLKRLIKKGFIKVVNIKPNRLRYELTPSGIARKTALAFRYVQASYVFYKEARNNLTRIFTALKASGVKTVVFYGTGEIAEIALLSLQEADLSLIGFVGARPPGGTFCGKAVYPAEELPLIAFDRLIVFDQEQPPAENFLKSLALEESKILYVGT